MKEKAAAEIASRVKDGETIGVGTGSTVDIAIELIAARVKQEKLKLRVVPSSYETAWICEEAGLSVLTPGFTGAIEWGFDGADEISPELWAIKGKGAAMLKEKILAAKCKNFVVVIDDTKLVKKLGEKFPVPVEVIPEARSVATAALTKLGATKIELREGGKKHGPVITEAGNIIFDVSFQSIHASLEREIKSIVGVVESGLFLGYIHEVIVAGANGIQLMKK